MKNIISSIILFIGSFFMLPSSVFSQTRVVQQSDMEVIQFHLEHRCFSCTAMEEYSRETVKSYPGVPFKLYNVEDKKNEQLANQFKASGTSLFLYNPKTGRIKDLTAGAFLSVGNKEKFIKELKKNIDDFKKSL